MKGVFLDTNVVLDMLLKRKPFSDAAGRLFRLAESGFITLYISALSYANIYYLVRKHWTHEETIVLLQNLEALTQTLDVTKETIQKSLKSSFKDFEDAIQYHSALSGAHVHMIVTRNGKDFAGSKILVQTPEEALLIIQD